MVQKTQRQKMGNQRFGKNSKHKMLSLTRLKNI